MTEPTTPPPSPAAALPPLATFQSLLHYNPISGQITYLQQRGRKRSGEPAGCTQGNHPHLFIQGRQRRAAAVCWALFHGADPAPLHVHPLDSNPHNLALDNLFLAPYPFIKPKAHRKHARRPSWHRQIKRDQDKGIWRVWHNRKIIAKCSSKAEALAVKRRAMEEEAYAKAQAAEFASAGNEDSNHSLSSHA